MESLPFHRVLNVAYSWIIEHTPTQDEDGKPVDKRGELDDMLKVHTWPVPRTMHGTNRYKEKVKSNAPAWWVDDEEASQSFLMEMGVPVR